MRFSDSEHAFRLEALRSAVRKAGYGAYVVYSDVNILYLTGLTVDSNERHVILIVPVEKPPIFIGPLLERDTLLKAAGVSDVRIYWDLDATEGRRWRDFVADAIKPLRKVAVEPNLPAEIYAVMSASGPIPCLPIIDEVRAIKSAAELKLIRRSAEFSDIGIERMFAKITSDATIGESVSRGSSIVKDMSQESVGMEHYYNRALMVCQAGPESAAPHFISSHETPIPQGQPTIVNSVTRYHGYCAEVERTFVKGSASKPMLELLNFITEAQQLAIDTIRPGMPCAEVDQLIQKYFAKHGHADHIRHRMGHGFGLSSHEKPFTAEGSPDTYLPNMVISIEPGMYIPGIGGFRHSDTVLVTETALEFLTGYARTYGRLDPRALVLS